MRGPGALVGASLVPTGHVLRIGVRDCFVCPGPVHSIRMDVVSSTGGGPTLAPRRIAVPHG
jgi:hypothetical protein